MRRRLGRGRGGPGLLGTVARTAVIAGTASAVAGRMSAGQDATTQRAQVRPVDDLHTQLLKLGELRQAGLLTDDEFEQQKARLLAP